MNNLDGLKAFTIIAADTGDFDEIKQYAPTDATTNPSLILKAAQKGYRHLLENAVAYAKKKTSDKKEQSTLIMEKAFVNFGCEILKVIPGRVSTEVDAHLSFDMKGSIAKAKKFIALYEEAGIPRHRILIKLASTWEGIKAVKELEKEGIHCNMTLMFSLVQAVAAAKVGATLISPFVGRIFDWYRKRDNVQSYPPAEDPGVISVRTIYNYYKKFGIPTQIMGASFRNKEQVLALAGCDLLTVSPELLKEIAAEQGSLTRALDPESAKKQKIQKIPINESHFRFLLNEDAMATEKLAEGIRVFAADADKLKDYILKNFS